MKPTHLLVRIHPDQAKDEDDEICVVECQEEDLPTIKRTIGRRVAKLRAVITAVSPEPIPEPQKRPLRRHIGSFDFKSWMALIA